MDQQLRHAALDRFEMAEPAFRGVELLHQLGDPVLEAADRQLLAARELVDACALQMLELVVERFDELIKLRRSAAWALRGLRDLSRLRDFSRLGGLGGLRRLGHLHGLRALRPHRLDGVGDRSDPLIERADEIGAKGRGKGRGRTALHPVGEPAHVLRQRRQRVARGDVVHHAAQGRNRGFERLQAGRILLAGGNPVDLGGETLHGGVEPDQAFGRREAAQRVAHVAQSLLEAGERRRIGPCLQPRVELAHQRAYLAFERLDGAARHRFREGAADLGQILAQTVDRFVGAAVDRREGRTLQRRRRGRRELAVERALSRRDLGDRVIDIHRRVLGNVLGRAYGHAHRRAHRRVHGRHPGRHSGRAGLATHVADAQALLAELGQRTVNAVDPSLERARCAAVLVDDLVEPAIELQDRVGDSIRRRIAVGTRRRTAFQAAELAAQIVEPLGDCCETLVALRIGLRASIAHALLGRLVVDDRGEPLAERHPDAVGRHERGLPRLRIDTPDLPRRRSHTSIHISDPRTGRTPDPGADIR